MILFVASKTGHNYSRRIERAVARGHHKTNLSTWQDFDYSQVRRMDPDKDLVFFRSGARASVRIARDFEDAGFRVMNDSRFIQLSAEKYLANVHARVNGIPTPTLNVSIRKDDTKLLALYLCQYGSLVAKPILSRNMGRHVYLVSKPADFADVATIPGSNILVQSEVTFNRLVRTIVTSEGMLVEATVYDTKRDSWKATVCSNPLAKHYRKVPPALTELAERTIRAFGGDIAYIDYFETDHGYVFSEINQACNLLPQERVTGVPIAQRLASFLVRAHAANRGNQRRPAAAREHSGR